MRGRVVIAVIAITLGVAPVAMAQARPQPPRTAPPAATPPPAPADAPAEIKLDEATTLKAAAVEARMAAIVANYALLQRQAQDLQQEMAKILEERKKLIEDAARRANASVSDTNEWAFDNKNQRYVHARRPPPPAR
jgi:hypothetical protein